MKYTIYRKHPITLDTARSTHGIERIAAEKARNFSWVFRSCRCSEEYKRTVLLVGHMNFSDLKTVRRGGPTSQDREEVFKRLSCIGCHREEYFDFDDMEAFVEAWDRLFYIIEASTVETTSLEDVEKLIKVQGNTSAYYATRPATDVDTAPRMQLQRGPLTNRQW